MTSQRLHEQLEAIEAERRDLRLFVIYLARERGGAIILDREQLDEIAHLDIQIEKQREEIIAKVIERYPTLGQT